MINLPMLDMIGWCGSVLVLLFYWFSGSGHMVIGYWCAIGGAAIWLCIGIATEFGYATAFPSLIALETAVIVLCFRGIRRLK